MSVFLSFSHTHLCSNTHRPTRSLQCVLPDSDLLCTVQSSVYESLTTTDRLQHVASVYSRYSSLVLLLEANVTKCTFTVQAAELACKLLMEDVEILINHSRQYRESTDGCEHLEKFILTSPGVTVCALLLLFILRDVQPDFLSQAWKTPICSSPAALASLSSIPAEGSRETWGGDQICRSRSYSLITLGCFQTCTNAIMGMRLCVQQSTLWHYITLSKNTGIAWTRMEEAQQVQAGHLQSVYGQKSAKYIFLVSLCMMSNGII